MDNVLSAMMVTCACGCVTSMPGEYRTQQAAMATDIPEESVLAAAARNARQQGWDVVMVDSVHGRMEALTPADSGQGQVTRERWTFSVEHGALTVEMALEARDQDEHHWLHTRQVCEGYGYVREQAQLARVTSLVQLDTQRQWANR